MKVQIYSRDANPSIDRPLFYAGRDRLNLLLATGAVQMLSKHSAQYTCELRDPEKIAKARKPVYADVSRIDNGRQWRIVHQTKPGMGPGMPEYQLVP